jgi:hypothetical protein
VVLPHIEVLATDGKTQKRVLWLDIRTNGIYAGFCNNNIDIHISYHADGHLFQTINNKSAKIADFPPLKNLKGVCQLGSFGFASNLSSSNVPYKMKRLDAVAYIDVRAFIKEKKDVGCNVCILEPKLDFLAPLIQNLGVTESHIFSKFNPWVLVTVHEITTDRYDFKP